MSREDVFKNSDGYKIFNAIMNSDRYIYGKYKWFGIRYWDIVFAEDPGI